jgi:uncharacterized membrane protein
MRNLPRTAESVEAAMTQGVQVAESSGWDAPAAVVGHASAAVRWSIRALAALALAIAGYLAWIAVSGGAVAGCAAAGPIDCDEVLSSRWSTWLGVPVGFLAVATYGSLLVTAAFIGPWVPPRTARLAWGLLVALAVMIGGAAAWFVGLQWLAVERFCTWCLAEHAASAMTAGIVFAGARAAWRTMPTETGADKLRFVRRPAALAVLAGMTGNAALVGGQLAYEPPGYVVEHRAISKPQPAADGDGGVRRGVRSGEAKRTGDVLVRSAEKVPVPPPTPATTPTTTPTPTTQRTVTVLGGSHTLDAGAHPILGSPQAAHVVVELFDYTCPHCRKLHRQMEAARRRYGDQLAILTLPVPMNGGCNRFAGLVSDGPHRFACLYARLALAVWRIDRTKFVQFHAWLMDSDDLRPWDEARRYAAKLVGEEPLEQERRHWGVSEMIGQYVDLFGASQKPSVPLILLETGGVIERKTASATQAQLFETLEKELRLTPRGR